MRALRYAFEEAVTSLWRGRPSGALSTGTIAVALFVLGGFLLVTSNLERVTAAWSRSAEVSVYLDEDATPADRAAIERLLAPGLFVAGFEFVSRGEAMRRFRLAFADLAPITDVLERNPLPASYEVRLNASAASRRQLDDLVGALQVTAGVADVRFDGAWLDRLQSAIGIVRAVGLILGAILTIAAALTVASVVRLALHARRDEIEIMQLVGAPRAFVRGPFVMEGVLQGGIGALLALVLLAAVYFAIRGSYLEPLAQAASMPAFRFLPLDLCLTLLAVGMAVGCLGGTLATSARAKFQS